MKIWYCVANRQHDTTKKIEMKKIKDNIYACDKCFQDMFTRSIWDYYKRIVILLNKTKKYDTEYCEHCGKTLRNCYCYWTEINKTYQRIEHQSFGMKGIEVLKRGGKIPRFSCERCKRIKDECTCWDRKYKCILCERERCSCHKQLNFNKFNQLIEEEWSNPDYADTATYLKELYKEKKWKKTISIY